MDAEINHSSIFPENMRIFDFRLFAQRICLRAFGMEIGVDLPNTGGGPLLDSYLDQSVPGPMK